MELSAAISKCVRCSQGNDGERCSNLFVGRVAGCGVIVDKGWRLGCCYEGFWLAAGIVFLFCGSGYGSGLASKVEWIERLGKKCW